MISRKSRRRMSPLGKRVAGLHNEAASLARRLKNLAGDVVLFELGVAKKRLEESDRRAFGKKK